MASEDGVANPVADFNLTVGAVMLTYVELNLQTAAPNLYPIMFGAVFIVNSLLAYDGYTEAKAISAALQTAR
jgi:hypothetical protein